MKEVSLKFMYRGEPEVDVLILGLDDEPVGREDLPVDDCLVDKLLEPRKAAADRRRLRLRVEDHQCGVEINNITETREGTEWHCLAELVDRPIEGAGVIDRDEREAVDRLVSIGKLGKGVWGQCCRDDGEVLRDDGEGVL
jgi:hypothetical protein